MSRLAASRSSFETKLSASSLVDAVAPRYRSGANATNPAVASRSQRSLKKSVRPHHAWRTRTPGPLPFFGTARYPGTLPSGLLSSAIPMFSRPLEGERPHRRLHLSLFGNGRSTPLREDQEVDRVGFDQAPSTPTIFV